MNLNNLLNGRDAVFGGLNVVIKDPLPVYKKVMLFKKHRKKPNWTRVKVFSHWQELLQNGEVINHRPSNTLYMNAATYDTLMKAI